MGGDNGGMPASAGNNWPLRGHKAELWEGGVRNNALVWGSLLPSRLQGATYSNGLMHVSDWHATFVGLAGATLPPKAALDGMNLWDAITSNTPSPRTEMLHNYDPCSGHGRCNGVEWSYRSGDLKLMSGVSEDTWYPVPTSESANSTASPAKTDLTGQVWWDEAHYSASASAMYLYNITADPTEKTDLLSGSTAGQYSAAVAKMTDTVKALVGGKDYKAPCNIPYGSCDFTDAAGTAAATSHKGWYPWVSGACMNACDASGECADTCDNLIKKYPCADNYALGKQYAGWCDKACGYGYCKAR